MKTVFKLELKSEGYMAHIIATHFNEKGEVENQLTISFNAKNKKKEDILAIIKDLTS